jgi:mono/diheme cytochrome c family protein
MERRMKQFTLAALLATAVTSGFLVDGPNAAESAKPYSVKNGVVDANTFTGYVRYEATCYWCHGQDGAGGAFAPSLVDALKTLNRDQFRQIAINGGINNGRTNLPSSNVFVMPGFGTNPNVMCFLDDIYAYLKGRSDGAIARGRPEHEPVTQAAKARDDSCLGFGS